MTPTFALKRKNSIYSPSGQKKKRIKKEFQNRLLHCSNTDYSQKLREALRRREANSKTVHIARKLAKPILSISTTQVLQKPTSLKVISQRPILRLLKNRITTEN